jgi:predicted dehydrogenase
MKLWLVGAGGMARDYSRVLDAMQLDYAVIGRGEESASRFEAASQSRVIRGGLELSLQRLAPPECAIICVGVEALAAATTTAIEGGIRRLLVEKPAGLNVEQILGVGALAARHGAEVYVAYNRRFYASVRAARSYIEADGGVVSFTFEFTEFAHEIEKLDKAAGVKEHWVLANSSHVLDLAFHLGGAPQELHASSSGSLAWHPSGAVFVGAGRTGGGASFAYHANWQSAGRWGVEVNTPRRRLIFRPLEQLQTMLRGEVSIAAAEIADAEIDRQFKPGLYRQVEAFIAGADRGSLCTLAEHLERVPLYARIAGYLPQAA